MRERGSYSHCNNISRQLRMVKAKKKKCVVFSGLTRLLSERCAHLLCYSDTGQAAEK